MLWEQIFRIQNIYNSVYLCQVQTIKLQRMSYTISQQVDLNESKFLSEQVNWDEEPTEEEIIEKAEQLARESLLKEMGPEWRPYVNRHGRVFYINLEEKKGYVDHPIDMFYKINYAIKTKRKIPTFQEYSIEQISQNPKIIFQEISNFHKDQGLRVVYQQSEEESVRKNTKRSLEEEQDQEQLSFLNIELENQLKAFRDQLQMAHRQQLSNYRKKQEQQYEIRLKGHDTAVKRLKSKRLQQIGQAFQKEWEDKNRSSSQKAVLATLNQLQTKKIKYEDMLAKQLELTYEIHRTKDISINYQLLSKSKVLNQKRRQRDRLLSQMRVKFQDKTSHQVHDAKRQFLQELQMFTKGRINFSQMFDRNLKQINKQSTKKRRFSIFYPDRIEAKSMKIEPNEVQQLQCSQAIWSKNEMAAEYVCRAKPSLSLRLFKRIL